MRSIVFSALLALLLAVNASAARVIVVDNRAPEGGDGSVEHPYRTVAAASDASKESDVIYLTPSATPYAETITLKRGQALVGAGDDAAIRSNGLDFPTGSEPATVQGTINLTGNNTVAGLTVIADKANGVSAAGSVDKITIRNVHFKTSNAMFGIYLASHAGDVSVIGGGLEATQNGGGVAIISGTGDVFFDQFPMSGTFSTAVRAEEHPLGAILFREGCDIRVDDASLDAIIAENLGGHTPFSFNAGLSIHGSSHRGIVAKNVVRLRVLGDASIATTNAAALDITDSAGDMTFRSVSAEGTTLQQGIHFVRFFGKASIQGGTIRGASVDAIHLEESRAIEFRGMVIDGGGGVTATKIRDVAFNNLDVRNANNVMLNDVDGVVQFDHCSLNAPVTIDQRLGTAAGSVALGRSHIDGHPLKALAAGTTKLKLEVNGTDLNGSAVTASATGTGQFTLAVHGGRFTNSNIEVNSVDSANVCTDFGGARFTPAEKAIHLAAADRARLSVAGARAADAEAIRRSIAENNNGAVATIEAPAASLSNTGKCD